MPMSLERQGEIARLILKAEMMREGIRPNEIQRGLPKKAKEIGLSLDELREFAEILSREVLEETFKK